MGLRQNGIYHLPNGQVLTAEGSVLFVNQSGDGLESHHYEVDEDGRLLHDGKMTAWDLSDLRNTGVTLPHCLTRMNG